VLFVVGFAATSQMAATNTLIQSRVPDELRSPRDGVYATMFMGVQPIGALIAWRSGKADWRASHADDFRIAGAAGKSILYFSWWS